MLSGSLPSSFGKMLLLTLLMYPKGPLANIEAFNEAPIEDLENNKGLFGNMPLA